MNAILQTIYSAEFFVGATSGAVMMKLYQWHHCRHLDKVHPLPGGAHRHVPGGDRHRLATGKPPFCRRAKLARTR